MIARLRVEFCGEWYDVVDRPEGFTVGREADLTIDDNPYLHRTFLTIVAENDLWWLLNVGGLLSATVSDASGQVQAWLAPGARLPIVFKHMHVMFTAGSFAYDFSVHTESDYYHPPVVRGAVAGSTTMMPVPLTSSQHLLIVALAENVLTQPVPGRGTIPSSSDAAARLGWTITTFNRKLDNVCDKLDKLGVAGLKGERSRLETNRRARLVEYALASRLVSVEDLPLLESAAVSATDSIPFDNK